MPPSPRDTRLLLFVGLAALAYYFLTLGGHQYSIDGIVMFQAAKALVFQHSWRLDPPVLWGRASIHVSGWPLGMTLAYVPLLLAWYPVFAWFPNLRPVPYDPSVAFNPALYSNLAYLLCSVLNPLLTAATACLVLATGRLLGFGRELATLGALAFAFASPAAAYARYDFSQPLAALAMTAVIWGLLRADLTGSRQPLAWAGVALGYGFLTRIEFVVLVPWIIGWAFLRGRRLGVRTAWAHAGILAGGLALAVAVHVGVNWIKFGDPTEFRGVRVAPLFPGSLRGFLLGLAGLLASPTHGILLFFPLAWLAVPGLRRLARDGTGAASLLGGVIAIWLVFYAAFRDWWGGWCWGPRYLIPVVPIVTLSAAAWASSHGGPRRPRRRAALIALSALGLLVSWNGMIGDFVSHLGWVQRHIGSPDALATQFRIAASPLVTGWWPQPGRPLDSVWVKLAMGRILPPVWARPTGLLGPLLLVGAIAWAWRRLVREVRARE